MTFKLWVTNFKCLNTDLLRLVYFDVDADFLIPKLVYLHKTIQFFSFIFYNLTLQNTNCIIFLVFKNQNKL